MSYVQPLVPIQEFWVKLNVLGIRPDVYEISNYGNIRRIEDKFPIKQQILENEYGAYRIVNLVTITSSQPKKYLVHRLVGLVFIPNPNNHSQINHLDNNGMNNCNINLEWVSGEYNTNYQSCIHNILLENLENYNIYKLIEQGFSNEDILNMIHTRLAIDTNYIEYIRESYIRNNPISEFDNDKRRVNSSKFPNKTTEYICSLFESGMTYFDFEEIARLISHDISDEKEAHTFRAYCKNLYTRKHHTHISKNYNW